MVYSIYSWRGRGGTSMLRSRGTRHRGPGLVLALAAAAILQLARGTVIGLEHRGHDVVLRTGCVGTWQFAGLSGLSVHSDLRATDAALNVSWNASTTERNSSAIVAAPCASAGPAQPAQYRVLLAALAYTFPRSLGPVGGVGFGSESPPEALATVVHGDIRVPRAKHDAEQVGMALAARAARGWWYRRAECSVLSATTTQRDGASLSVRTTFAPLEPPCNATFAESCPGLGVGPDAHVCIDGTCYAVAGPVCLPHQPCPNGGTGPQCAPCARGLFRAGEAHEACVALPDGIECAWMSRVLAPGARFPVRGARAGGPGLWRLDVALRPGETPAYVAADWHQRAPLQRTVLRVSYALAHVGDALAVHDTTHAWVWAVGVDYATQRRLSDELVRLAPALPPRLLTILVTIAQTTLAILLAVLVFTHGLTAPPRDTAGKPIYVPLPDIPAARLPTPTAYAGHGPMKTTSRRPESLVF